ncbi:hypothetical protein [Kitasatospora acidiphila]|uniref:hypothetical protein n=1 Tax=Kitasatospora acidiphila TaxID=2567942 RepID=UPI003C78C43B
MTDQRHPAESPQPPLRRPGRARTNTGTTLAQPGARSLHEPETTVSTPQSRPSGTAATHQRIPGQWPEGCQRPSHDDQTWMRLQAGRARREVVLGSIRADLAEQPSPRAVRAAVRRWCTAIVQLGDGVTREQEEVTNW